MILKKIKELKDSGEIPDLNVNIDSWMIYNCHYETIVGSMSYGVSNEDSSDQDILGIVIPRKEVLFPHIDGYIYGFGTKPQNFECWQQHHINLSDKQYDISMYSIVKYFDLCMQNNPNIVDSLFVKENCITHITSIGRNIRSNRKLFLHKGCYHKFKGYAYSQLHKIKTKDPIGKRKEMIEKYGYDVKFAYHVVRLCDECEQILTTGDLDLHHNKEQLKSIRRGEWTVEQIEEWFEQKSKHLEDLYANSQAVPHSPDEKKIKELLLNCLEAHYGKLDNVIKKDISVNNVLDDLRRVIEKYEEF